MKREEILKQVRELQPAYLPAWNPNEKDSGWAVAELFANMMSELYEEFNNVPNKLFIAYLNKLGFIQNPPLSAKVPVTFTLTKNFKRGAIVPKGTVIGTQSKINFETQEAFIATSSKLTALIDYELYGNNIYSKDLTSLFEEEKSMKLFRKVEDEHYLYFADDTLFNIYKKESTDVGLTLYIPSVSSRIWQYFGKSKEEDNARWHNFQMKEKTLYKSHANGTVKTEINGIESYWIRAKIDNQELPSSLKMNFESYSNVDSLFYNDKPILFKPNFLPFGQVPQMNDNLYIASREAFSKKGFNIEVALQKSTYGLLEDERLSWEYWNGKSWKALGGHSFKCPRDIAQTTVNGEENYWIRVRLIDNSDYVSYKCSGSNLEPSFNPPELKHINIKVQKKGEDVASAYIYEYEKKNYTKLEATNRPVKIEENTQQRSLYFGFDKAFDSGLISIYFKIKELDSENVLTWYYFSKEHTWTRLNVKDGTNGFTQSGFCQFLSPADQGVVTKFGHSLHWIKAESKNSENYEIEAIYMNSIEASEGKTITNTLLGSSDGSGFQVFSLNVAPIFDVKVWVRETQLPSDYEGYKDRFKEGYWVLWSEVSTFETLYANRRVYKLNSSLGQISFADDRNGKIPPMAKDNIRISYRIGGGIQGNVLANEIDGLVDTLAYVDKVFNPVAALGAANLQSMDNLLTMAPKRIKHRYRATTKEDYDYLVREVSSEVAKVAISLTKKGLVELLVVPFGQEERPFASRGLLRVVQESIQKVAPATIKIKTDVANYVALNIDIKIILSDWKYATEMKGIIQERLKLFLHPLYGGKNSEGWAFGTLPLLADFYQLLSDIEGITLIDGLIVTLDNMNISAVEDYSINDQTMPSLSQKDLICNGKHTVNLEMGGR